MRTESDGLAGKVQGWQLLCLVSRCPHASKLEISRELGTTAVKVEKSISELVLSGRLEWIGPPRGGQWRVIAPVFVVDDGVSDLRRLGSVFLIGLVLFTQFAWAAQFDLVLNARSTGVIDFNTNSVQRMRLTNDGNLGIGTSSPAFKLDVNGQLRVAGDLNVSAGAAVLDANIAAGLTGLGSSGVVVAGNYAYVSARNNGSANLAVIDISNPKSPVVLSTYNTTAAGPIGIAVAGNYVYVVERDNGSNNRIFVVDVSNHFAPRFVGTAGTTTAPASPNSVVVAGRHLYVAGHSADNNLTIFDVSKPTAPFKVGDVNVGSGTIGVYVDGNFVYTANRDTSDIAVVDVTNPAVPVKVKAFGVSAQLLVGQGRYLYAVSNNTLTVVDVNNPYSPRQAATLTLSQNNAAGVGVFGKYFYSLGSTILDLVDISNPDAPVIANSTTFSGSGFVASALSGKYIYATNGGTGFSAIRLKGIETPTLIAGSAQIGELQVLNNAKLAGTLYADKGINVGPQGIYSQGPLSVLGQGFFDGNVGIGTAAPSARLQVFGASGDTNLLSVNRSTGAPAIVVLASDGDVGIGTATPSARLVVSSTAASKTVNVLTLDNGSGDNNSGVRLNFNMSTSPTANTASMEAVRTNVSGNLGTYIAFSNYNVAGAVMAERMRIAEDGNVIIGNGTTLPKALLHLFSANASETPMEVLRLQNNGSGGAATPYASFYYGDGGSNVDGTEGLGELRFYGSYDASNFVQGAAIIATADGSAFTASNAQTRLGFLTSASGSVTPTERMTIKSDGNVGINDTTPSGILDVDTSGAADALVINNQSGNVGIGTTSPGAKLHVEKNTASSAFGTYPSIILNNLSTESSSFSEMRVESNNGTVNLALLSDGLGSGGAISGSDVGVAVGSQSNHILALVTNNTERMRIDTSGNVGIGDPTPDAKLDVNGINSNADVFRVDANGDVNPVVGLLVDKNGNVGIGTTTPSYKLDVNGTGWIRGAADKNGLYVNSSGNVGIGTTTVQAYPLPAAGLDVEQPSTGVIKIGGDATVSTARRAILQLAMTDNDNRALGVITTKADVENWFFGQPYNGTGFDIGYGSTNPEYLAQSRFYITTDGNVGINDTSPSGILDVDANTVADVFVINGQSGYVGIGTSSPSQKLDVNGTIQQGNGVNYIQFIQIGGGSQILTNSGRPIYFYPGGTGSVGIDSGGGVSIGQAQFSQTPPTNGLTVQGNVGIGTTAPGYKLDVNGSINLTNNDADVNGLIYFNGTRFLHRSGSGNLFVGSSSGTLTTSGSGENVGVGSSALTAVTTGYRNVAVGTSALAGNTTGNTNVAVGRAALNVNTTGSSNIAIGNNAGAALTTGTNNIFLGYLAGDAAVTNIGNIVIGNNIDIAGDANNTLDIGNVLYGTGINSTGTTVDTDANIGVRTSTPKGALNVIGDLNVSASGSASAPSLFANSTDGNVGIGTATPRSKLEVAGDVNLSTSSPRISLGAAYIQRNADGHVIITD